ncbi:MAG: threonine dehydratase [Paracoccaceae bacterium]|nr:threonine dehydratase [Paracoccaceae bacterium]
MFPAAELRAACDLVYSQMPPTPQYVWPTLTKRFGAEVWVKHENHGPTGAFKVRGGITYIDWLKRAHPDASGICTATRGNHGQSQARAALAAGLTAKVYVPFGNSVEKNAAMRAFGAEVIEFGHDFETAREEAFRVADAENLAIVPSYHTELVRGVATYGYEFLTAAPDLDTVYVPIGCGSGICGVIAARDALGLDCEVVGVVSEHAQCALLSAQSDRLVETNSAHTFADGMAVRVPIQDALDVYAKGAARIIKVSEAEIAQACHIYFTDIHNVAEGAGAAALAGLIHEQAIMRNKNVGVILSGGNIDAPQFSTILNGGIPTVNT